MLKGLRIKGFSRAGGRIAMFGLFCAISVGLVLLFSFRLPLRALYIAEYELQDRLMELPVARSTAENENFVLMGIDEPSMAGDTFSPEERDSSLALQSMADGYPWPREVWGLILDRILRDGEARLVVIDVFFGKDSLADEGFKAALDRYGDRVVIGSKFERWTANQATANDLLTIAFPTESLISETRPIDSRLGYVNFFPEVDDTVRAVQLESTLEMLNNYEEDPNSEWFRSLTGAALAKMGRDDLLTKQRRETRFRFTRMSRWTYQPQSIYQVFVDKIWERNYAGGEYFKDKIVFIGPSASIFQDFHTGPYGRMLGVHFHMSALAAVLSRETYERSSSTINLWLIIFMGMLAALLVELVKAPFLRVFMLLGAGALYLGLTIFVFNQLDILITCMVPLVAYTSSGVLCFGYDIALRAMEGLRVRRALERYVSKDLAHEILENREDYMTSLGGTDKEMTMLFSDIRGFTTITEQMGGKEIVPKLNEYLKEMVPAVFEFNGSLDKFIGDAVMAVWGNVKTEGAKIDAMSAVRSAVSMRKRLAALNERWAEEGKEPFHIGIGLHSGHAIFGNIGSDDRMDPTVIGDAVNLAARLESLTKKYQSDIIVSESIANYVKEDFVLRSVDLVTVKGKSEAVAIFSVLGVVKEVGPMSAWLEKYEEGVKAFRTREFSRAIELMGDVMEMRPGDYLSQMYLEQAREFLVNPPEEDWEGVTVVTSK